MGRATALITSVLVATTLVAAPMTASAKDGDVIRRGSCTAQLRLEAEAQPGERPHRGRVRGRPEPQRPEVERQDEAQRQRLLARRANDAAAERLVRGAQGHSATAPAPTGSSSRAREPTDRRGLPRRGHVPRASGDHPGANQAHRGDASTTTYPNDRSHRSPALALAGAMALAQPPPSRRSPASPRTASDHRRRPRATTWAPTSSGPRA